MFWCNLFQCENKEVDKFELFLDTKEAGCNSNCELCLFSANTENHTSDISVSA
ncbi:MAG: hypothetical protein IJ086_00530 [Clostridium sp.]|nr:hypothetical protein [Clostridium sp.]